MAAHKKQHRSAVVRYGARGIKGLLLTAVLGGILVVVLALVRGTWIVTPVLSGSMRPGLSVGGVVVSQRVPISQLAPREVIVFQNPLYSNEQMVHRIVKLTRTPTGILEAKTQGDANSVEDPWTLKLTGQDVYRVRWSLPLLGYLAVAFQNYRGFFLQFAGLLLVLFAASTYLGSLVRSEVRRPRAAQPPAGNTAPPARSTAPWDRVGPLG